MDSFFYMEVYTLGPKMEVICFNIHDSAGYFMASKSCSLSAYLLYIQVRNNLLHDIEIKINTLTSLKKQT